MFLIFQNHQKTKIIKRIFGLKKVTINDDINALKKNKNMILPFSTQMNGKPTYFVERIWEAILTKGILCNAVEMAQIGTKALPENYLVGTHKPKLHPIREDKNDRWQEGKRIDFFINCRQKDMFRFAPVLPVVSIQEVLMTYSYNDLIQISIDENELFGHIERLEFARNDGFDTWEDFFNYFYPKIIAAPKQVYTAKLIHWTDLKY